MEKGKIDNYMWGKQRLGNWSRKCSESVTVRATPKSDADNANRQINQIGHCCPRVLSLPSPPKPRDLPTLDLIKYFLIDLVASWVSLFFFLIENSFLYYPKNILLLF